MKKLQKKSRHCKPFAVTAPNIVSLYNDGHRPNAHKQVGNTKTTISFLKNTILFLSFLILGFGSELKAQESPKWEIGTDLLWLVGKNTLPEYSLFGRYKLSDKHALRARIGMANSLADNSRPRLWDKGQFMIRIGYERRKSFLNDQLTAYYGLDFHYSYGKSYILNPFGTGYNRVYYNDLLDYDRDFIYRFDSGLGGVLVLGLQYHLNEHISFSIEPTFSAIHATQRLKPSFAQGQRRSVNYWETTISPISVLNFSFHF